MSIYHEVQPVLMRWHDAAVAAEEDLFFSLMTPDAWFIGTDDTEVWDFAAFRSASKEKFEEAPAWVMWHEKLVITGTSPDGQMVSFVELLHSDGLGPCRGSGVLRKEDGKWKIAQYVLSISIPNDAIQRVKRVVHLSTTDVLHA